MFFVVQDFPATGVTAYEAGTLPAEKSKTNVIKATNFRNFTHPPSQDNNTAADYSEAPRATLVNGSEEGTNCLELSSAFGQLSMQS